MSEPRKRRAAVPRGKAAARVKKSIVMDADLARRLAIYAAGAGRDESDVVTEALAPILQGVYVARKPQGGAAAEAGVTEPSERPRLAAAG